MLYLVATPIGNLEDISFRAIKTLREVDLILAEDTRTAKKLLQHYQIDTTVQAFHAFNEHKSTERIIDQLQAGQHIALISDAGTPGISDPGFLLARACREHEVAITVIPGATAFVPALVASGLPCDKFHFEGFLPHKKGRKTRLTFLSTLPTTFVLYESPHRLSRCLLELAEVCGPDRKATIGRELTKLFEEIKHGTLQELANYFPKGKKIKGEIVIVVEGS